MAIDTDTTSRQLLCVLGMHRSGTSAVAQLLHRLGARAPAGLLAAMDGVNEDGFWEDAEVVRLDEALLTARGRRWYDFAGPRLAADDSDVESLRLDALAHFNRQYEGAGPWVVKDPRLCRLLPFWLEVWRDAGLQPVFIQVVRHPFAVAQSLHKRDRIPYESGVVLWLLHTLEAMSHSVDQPGVVVVFEDFILDPLRLPRALAALGISLPVDQGSWQQVAETAIKSRMQHHSGELAVPGATSIGAEAGLPGLTAFALRVYEALRLADDAASRRDQLAAWTGELQSLLSRHRDELRMLQRLGVELMAASAEAVRIGEMHTHALAVIRDKDKTIAEYNRIIRDIKHLKFWRLLPLLVRGARKR